jgi:hypothetical protein
MFPFNYTAWYEKVYEQASNYRMRRLITVAIITYLVSLVASVFLIAFFGLNEVIRAVSEPHLTIWLATYSLVALIAYGAAKWYLRDVRINATPREGFIFGLGLVVMGATLDMLVVIPHGLIVGSYDMVWFYVEPFFLLGVLIIFLATTLSGVYEEALRKAVRGNRPVAGLE